jgi:ABC-type multidrug transport system fused ATPase/permease subunit
MMISQEAIDLSMKIAGILIPTIVSPVITYFWLSRRMTNLSRELEDHKSRLQSILGKEIEDYKKVISKELENHKFQLQSDFQARFYEFQTKYSLLHQKKAEAIERFFELLARFQNDLQIWANWEYISRPITIDELEAKTSNDFQVMIDFFDEKRIYFDTEIRDLALELVRVSSRIVDRSRGFGTSESLSLTDQNYAQWLRENARSILANHIHPIVRELESKFRVLLSAEIK